MLRELLEAQESRCALSGITIGQGSGASVDHIVPVSKGGTHDRSNLRWLSLDVNKAKMALSDAEFIAMCRRVVEMADR